MNNRDGNRTSLWQAETKLSKEKTTTDNQTFDVLIIGAGITGATTALNLQRKGKRCLLVDGHHAAFGTTGGTTAHLNTFLDATYPEIDSDFGKETSKLIADAAKRTIKQIETNVESLGIEADFEYKDGYLFSQNEKETGQLEEIFESSQQAGVAVAIANENGVEIPFQKALKFAYQAQFHPVKYVNGIIEEFLKLGGEFLENTFITEVAYEGKIHHAKSGEEEYLAENVFWATHIPPGINLLSLRNAPYRSYVIAAELASGNYPDCLSYDMKEPYHYFRSHEIEGKKFLIIGGEDHKTGHDDPLAAFRALEEYAYNHFDISTVRYRWSSQYYVPVDGLPYIGQLPGGAENTFVATGFNGNGMIFGSLAGEIITDLILGNKNPLSEILNPSRLKPIAGFSEFVKENADVTYRFIADRFNTELIASTKEIHFNEGKVVTLDGKKVAIYKDPAGKITALKPVCTHAGCIVHWNTSEKSWDCPCHGGRFSTDGKVLTGPPTIGLEKIDLSK